MAEGQDHLILVVSDDEHVREEASYGFPEEVEIVLTDDAITAWKHLDDWVPSLVIVALRTGNSGGFALARDMSQRTDLEQVPVMVLLEREQDAWLAKQARVRSFKTKPLNPGELVAEAMDILAA